MLGERLNGIQEVSGSIPLISTNKKASNHYDLKPFSCFFHFFAQFFMPNLSGMNFLFFRCCTWRALAPKSLQSPYR